MRSKNLVAASRDLFLSFGDSFVKPEDYIVIFSSTNKININNHLLLSRNRALELGERGLFAHLLTCSLGSLPHSKVTLLSFGLLLPFSAWFRLVRSQPRVDNNQNNTKP